jgi:restriction endonuclease S subunit
LENIESYRLEDGDFLFARTGSVGRTYVYRKSDGDCIFAGYLIRFRLNKKLIDPQFLFLFSKSPAYRNWVATKQRVAIQANINGGEYASLRVPLPTPREQRRIVELLEQADGLLRQRAEADQLADRILPTLFYKMFGDPATNPKGWPVENLLKICSPKQWPTISSKEILESGYPVYGANGKIGFYDSYNHEFPTVLITCRGATCGTINVCEPKCYVTGNAMSLDDPDENKTSLEFLECYLRVRGLRDTITGAAQPQITRTNLGIVNVFTPPPPLVDNFSEMRRSIGKLIGDMQRATDELQKLFSTMLYRAFTGELTAKWREAHLKELLAEMEQQARLLHAPSENN